MTVMSESPKWMNRTNALLVASLLLASCSPIETVRPTETASAETKESPAVEQSPVIICSAPEEFVDKRTNPNATIWIYFERRDPKDPNLLSIETQLFSGSETFKANSDGSLNEVEIPSENGNATLVHPDVDVFLPLARLQDGGIVGVDLDGCLVDSRDARKLKEFLTPGFRFDQQLGNLPKRQIPQKGNIFKGDRHTVTHSAASKPRMNGRSGPMNRRI